MSDAIYRDLQIHLDKLPVGYPATESGVEIEILKYFFTPQEAMAALCLGLAHSPAQRIRKRMLKEFNVDIPVYELEAMLDRLFMEGSIRRSDKKPYGYNSEG